MSKKPKKFFSDNSITFRCHHGACPKRLKRQFKCRRCFMTFCQEHSTRPYAGDRICFCCEREEKNRAAFLQTASMREARERAQWEAEHDPAGASQDVYGW